MKTILLFLTVLVSTNIFSQTVITNENFHEAISTCLSTNPVDGLCYNNEFGAMPDWDVSNVTTMAAAFQGLNEFNADISAWDVSNVTNMAVMFNSVDSFNADISSWDVSNVSNMFGMFLLADVFNADISSWDVSNVTNMEKMFWEAKAFNSNISDWDVSNVTIMEWMFLGAEAFNSDIGSWDVTNLDKMSYMFKDAIVFNGDISAWDVSNVTRMEHMFQNAKAFNADIGDWNVEKVIDMSNMFHGATSFNADISGWDVSNVILITSMFRDAESFSSDLSSWDISNIYSLGVMFRFSGLTFEHYDAILEGWSQQDVMPNVDLGVAGIFFCESWNARQILKNEHGWTINDYGYDSNCTVGISEEEELSVNVYPIPTSGILKIDGERKKFKAVISDVLGKVVFTENITDKINISALDNGIYFISLSSGLKSSTHKIVKN